MLSRGDITSAVLANISTLNVLTSILHFIYLHAILFNLSYGIVVSIPSGIHEAE